MSLSRKKNNNSQRKWYVHVLDGHPHIFYASSQAEAVNDKGLSLGKILHCQHSSSNTMKVKFNCENGYKTLDITYCEPFELSRSLFPLSNGKDFVTKACELFNIAEVRSPGQTSRGESYPPAKRPRQDHANVETHSTQPSNENLGNSSQPLHRETAPPDNTLGDEIELETNSTDQFSTFLQFAIKGDVATKVLTKSLRRPRPEYELRHIDKVFVEELKSQMISNPVPGQKPLVVVVKGIRYKEEFKEENLDAYELEVIGGNHRRVALQELNTEYKDVDRFKAVDAILFTEMPAQAAIKLAQGHNIMDQFSHDVTCQDKVKLCRKLFETTFVSSRTEWRAYCIALFQSSKDKMDYVFFLASLPDAAYAILVNVIDKFEGFAIKGQKQSTAKSCKSIKNRSKPDLTASKFKPMRGLKDEDLVEVLRELSDGSSSFKEAAERATTLKVLYAAKENFLLLSGISSWNEATKRFPEYTSKEMLLKFQFKKGHCSEDFEHYVKMALLEEENRSKAGEQSNIDFDPIFIKQSPLDFTVQSLLENNFHGVKLVVLHCEKEWSSDDITILVKKISGINARNGIKDYSILLPGKAVEEIDNLLKPINCSYAENIFIFDTDIEPKEKNHLTPAVERMALILFGASRVKKTNAVVFSSSKKTKNVIELAAEGLTSPTSSIMELGDRAGELMVMAQNKGVQLFVITSKSSRISELKAALIKMRQTK